VGLKPGTRGVGPGGQPVAPALLAVGPEVRIDTRPRPPWSASSTPADGDHRDAFARYRQRMQDFVERNQQIATGNAKRFTPASRRQIWLQNQGIRALPYMPGKNWILSLATKGVAAAANAITLPSATARE
jgi:hypothetical protein